MDYPHELTDRQLTDMLAAAELMAAGDVTTRDGWIACILAREAERRQRKEAA